MLKLPYPAKELNPNRRSHWAVTAKHKKVAREQAFYLTKMAKVELIGTGAIDLHITFMPPDKRGRDMDNMLASCKSMIDGIADALGVNDKRFRYHLAIGEVIKGGLVQIEVCG